MRKKILTTLSLVALGATSVATLAACGGSVDYDHTIVFYHTMGDKLQTDLNVQIEKFQNDFPGWKIESVQAGGYDQTRSKIVADLQGGSQPDLAYCYADHVALYMQTKKVVDMSKILKSEKTVNNKDGKAIRVGFTDAEVADIVEGYYNEGFATNYADYEKYGYTKDSLLTLPYSKSTELVYYNKTALDGAGLQPATTWDELWEQAKVLSEKYPKAVTLGYDSESNWFITMCEQNGWGYTTAAGAADEHYLFNNTQAAEWLDSLAEKYTKGYITTQKESGAYTSNLFTKGVDEGGIIYCIGSSGGASYQNPGKKFEYGIAPVFASVNNSTKRKAAISQGPNLVMLECDRAKDKTAKAEMTFLFLSKYLLDPTFQAQFSITSGYNPVRKSTNEIPAYVEHMNGDNITAKAAKVGASMVNDFFTSPAFVGSSTARDQVGQALVDVLTGVRTGQEALREALRNCGGKLA